MKKVLLSIFAGALAISPSFSQGISYSKGHPVSGSEFRALKQKHQSKLNVNRELIDVPFYIDYSVLDNQDQGATADYERFVWPLNSRYVSGDGGSIFNFAGVVFRNWNGYTDPSDPQGTFDETQPSANRYLHIDSVFVVVTHENNSGLEDTLIVQISRQGATGGFSQAAPLVWQDTIKTTESLSPSGNWLGSNTLVTLSYAPDLDLPVNTFPGISLKYLGDKSDSLGFLGSYTPNPAGPASPNSIPLATNYPYSYLRMPGRLDDAIFNPSGVFYVDSEGKPEIDPTSNDTVFFYVQNIEMWIQATVVEVSGIEENAANGIRLGNIFPNPMTEVAGLYISLDKPSEVSVEIYDIAGKLVSTQAQGRLMAGESKINVNASALQAGSYIYRVIAENGASSARKFTVVR